MQEPDRFRSFSLLSAGISSQQCKVQVLCAQRAEESVLGRVSIHLDQREYKFKKKVEGIRCISCCGQTTSCIGTWDDWRFERDARRLKKFTGAGAVVYSCRPRYAGD